jgi:peptidoglycan/LPS O-acetylase OafA/YrhL
MNRIPALDGYRGIAVLLVFFAHLFIGTAPTGRPFAPWTGEWLTGGGLVGVQMFFVLSGYLITGILLRELGTGDVDVPRFWFRRMRRLYPALLALVVGYQCIALAVPTLVPEDRWPDLAHALTYTSDFLPFGPWGWLGHTWSLAVEEQFYLCWPLLLLLGWRIGAERGVFYIAAIGFVGTLLLRSFSQMNADGIDSLLRWDALFVGCALAVVYPRLTVFRGQIAIGIVGFLLISAYCFAPLALPGDRYAITAIASGAALLAAPRFRPLESGLLRYLGRVSYSLYLWHALILRFGLPGPISLALSLIAAELSYRYIERRFWTPHSVTSFRPASA